MGCIFVLKARTGFIMGILATGCMMAPTAHADIVVNGNFDANSRATLTASQGWTLTTAASSDFFVGPGPGFNAKARTAPLLSGANSFGVPPGLIKAHLTSKGH